MKRTIQLLATAGILAILFAMGLSVLAENSPNFWRVTCYSSTVEGYIQIQPAYIEANNKQAYNGRMNLLTIKPNNSVVETGYFYTGNGLGPNDTTIYSNSRSLPYTSTYVIGNQHYFTWIDADSGIWPQNNQPTE